MKRRKQTKNINTVIVGCLFFIASLVFQLSIFSYRIPYIFAHYSALQSFSLIIYLIGAAIAVRANKYKIKNMPFLLVSIMVGFLVAFVSHDLTILASSLYIVSTIGLSSKNVIRIDLIIKIIITIFVVANYCVGITDNNLELYRNGNIRASFGFAHPNTLGYMALIIYADLLYLLKAKNKKVLSILLLVPFLIVAIMADSRTSIIAMSILFIINCFDFEKEKSNKTTKKLVLLIPIIIFIFSVIGTHLYINNNEVAKATDKVLSARLYYQAYYEQNYEKTLLGKRLDELNRYPLDNGYYRIMYSAGILGVLFCLYFIMKALSMAQKNNDKILIKYLLLFSVYCISEWSALNANITPFWAIIYSKKANDEKTKSIA